MSFSMRENKICFKLEIFCEINKVASFCKLSAFIYKIKYKLFLPG